ncbi:OB-fold domain-containing protein [Paraburkholderia fungorum]|uniref:Zn-ribbon domain-containing OB-fold protein n=1 Tax=Paraburkholderia TaxID=1822464 RepID=UPI0038BB04E3
MSDSYLPAGLPAPVPEADGVSAPYWEGLREEKLRVQRCTHCQTWQFGPEWICHACRKFDPIWEEIAPQGNIFSWERVWHPSHPSLANNLPYVVVLVEFPQAGNVRMLGNLLGDPTQTVSIGTPVVGVFEHHHDSAPPYTLLNWRLTT